MIKLTVIALGLLGSTAAMACERGDFSCLIDDIRRENRERDEAYARRIHEQNMENEAFLSRQKMNEQTIDNQLRNYYMRNDNWR